jgi:hypothetical protein
MTDQTTDPREKLLAARLESGGAITASTTGVEQDQDGEDCFAAEEPS